MWRKLLLRAIMSYVHGARIDLRWIICGRDELKNYFMIDCTIPTISFHLEFHFWDADLDDLASSALKDSSRRNLEPLSFGSLDLSSGYKNVDKEWCLSGRTQEESGSTLYHLSSLSLLVRSQEANWLVFHLVQDYQSDCVYLLGEIVGVWALYESYE